MELKVLKVLGWMLCPVTPYQILHEVVLSSGLPMARRFPEPMDSFSRSLERKFIPLLLVVSMNHDLCFLEPSVVLLGCLEFLERKGGLAKLGLDFGKCCQLIKSGSKSVKYYIN